MSVDFCMKKRTTFNELFDGRLYKHGITGWVERNDCSSGLGWLSDGKNTLAVDANDS
jgi:hypothetical protein